MCQRRLCPVAARPVGPEGQPVPCRRSPRPLPSPWQPPPCSPSLWRPVLWTVRGSHTAHGPLVRPPPAAGDFEVHPCPRGRGVPPSSWLSGSRVCSSGRVRLLRQTEGPAQGPGSPGMGPGWELLHAGRLWSRPHPSLLQPYGPWDRGLDLGLRAPRASPAPECQAGEGPAGGLSEACLRRAARETSCR